MKQFLVRTFMLTIIVSIFLQCSVNVSAKEPYNGYIYDSWGKSEYAPNGYEAVGVINEKQMGISLSDPKDMYYRNGKLYILDTGNNRVVVLNADYSVEHIVSSFYTKDGTMSPLNNPNGFFVKSNGELIIADTDNNRVIICDDSGKISSILEKPQSEIFSDSLDFKPLKVIADRLGNTYVVCKQFYYGAVVYDNMGVFSGYFGANKVEASVSLLADRFWKKFMTKEQIGYTSKYVPVEFSSCDIDDKNFIYTCSMSVQSASDSVKKLNSLGSNILDSTKFGDQETMNYNGRYVKSQLMDIEISDDNNINLLDFTTGRVFQYDQDGDLVSIFGGKGVQNGLVAIPSAIESIGNDKILLLDSEKGNLTIYSLTEYGVALHNAIRNYSEGLYTEALDSWQDVLRYNENSEIAYRGIGKAYLKQHNYKEAMRYLELGQDKEGYSQAKAAERSAMSKQYFGWYVALIAIVVVFLIKRKKIVSSIKIKLGKDPKAVHYTNPFTVIRHPVEGFDELRHIKTHKPTLIAIMITLVWILGSVLQKQLTGFSFNDSRADEFNIFYVLSGTVGLLFLWAISNTAIASFMTGEATFRQTWVSTTYAMVPYIVSIYIGTILSNAVVLEEKVWLVIVYSLGIGLTAVYLLISTIQTQQFSFGKGILACILTLFGILLMLFIMMLVVSLFQQFYIFISTIINEALLRA